MKMSSRLIISISLFACAPGSESARKAEVISAIVPKIPRPCRGDLYFVDVPVWATPPSMSPSQFRSNLIAQLDASMQVAWFCGPDGPSCTDPSTVPAIRASAGAVLQQRTVSNATWRNDGHQRFYRVTFGSSADRARTPMYARPSKTCEVVAQLRASVAVVAPGAAMWVGRDCEGSASDSTMEAMPTSEMLDWHLDRMRVPTTPQPASTVDLVLIDSGIEPAAAASLVVAGTRSFGNLSPKLHPHGSGMASLIRTIAQHTALYDFRVLGYEGHTPTAPLAQALDAALFEVKTSDRPMIINMSLGWPRIDSEYYDLDGTACSTWEDPSGEAVRYLVHGTGLNDRATLIAAAGNDPTRSNPFDGSMSPPTGQPTAPLCAALNDRSDWFYPALWDVQESCFMNGHSTEHPIGVSGTNDREQASAVGIVGDESPLVAPSDHVYAEIPGVPQNAANVCPPVIGVRETQSPLAFSGSSVSAALVSAAAARAQELRLGSGQPRLSSAQIEQLLYLTGEALCRSNRTNVPVRRLHVGHVEDAFAHGCVADLLHCSGSNGEVDGLTLANCAAAVDACGFGPAANCTPPDVEAIGWSTIPSTLACDGDFSVVPQLGTCVLDSCPFISPPNKAILASTGPQPETSGCPECLFASTQQAWTLYAQLSSNFPAGTQFLNPFIKFTDAAGNTSYIQLVPLTPSSAWGPGKYVKVGIPPTVLAPVGDAKNIQAVLVMTVLQGGSSASDYSTLRVAVGQ